MDVNGVCQPTASCGPGTKDDGNGTCVPDCGPGTAPDPTTGQCVLQGADCQDGTVLINNACVDPTKGLTIDVEEGAEPNGIGFLGVECAPDANGACTTQPAGTIPLKGTGMTTVVHGHTTPFQDENGDGIMDLDADVYIVQATAPTLLHVTVDGVGGQNGGMASVAVNLTDPNDPLAAYQRIAVNTKGDTADRELMLPEAGTYAVLVTDGRTIFQFLSGGTPTAFGDANSEYYMSITPEDLPTATALTQSDTVDTIDAGKVKVYSATMGQGFNDVLVNSGGDGSLNAAFEVLNNNSFRTNAEPSVDPFFGIPIPPEAFVGGIKTGDNTQIIIDPDFDNSTQAQPIEVILTTGDAQPLPTDGSTSTEPEQIVTPPQANADIPLMNTWFFDVAADGEADGINMHWSQPVDGLLLDSNLFIVSDFTFDPAAGFTGNTFSDYAGMIRSLKAGRYYFLVYDPAGTAGTSTLAVTSTFAALTPTPITEGTQTGALADAPFNSVPFTYAKGADPWQQFSAQGSGLGNLTVGFYDPNNAFGRMDALVTADGTLAEETVPVFQKVLTPGTGGNAGVAKGEIMLDFSQSQFFGKVNAATPANQNFKLTFEQKTFGDFGTINAGDAAVVKANNTLGANGSAFFLVLTNDPANLLKFVGTPTGTIKPDIAVHNLNADESVATTVNALGTNPETAVFPPQKNLWVAISVTNGAVGGTFDLSAVVSAEAVYSTSQPNAAYVTVCNGAGTTDIAMHDDGSGFGTDDDALSNPFTVGGNFQFFGASVSTIQISTNGWFSFQTTQTDSGGFFNPNTDLPDANNPNALVAPYWTDLGGVRVCATTLGNVTTVEWQGFSFISGANVNVQAKLNAANQTIEFIYDPANSDDGADATIGIEDFGGANASKVDFNGAFGTDSGGTAFTLAPPKGFLFTPN